MEAIKVGDWVEPVPGTKMRGLSWPRTWPQQVRFVHEHAGTVRLDDPSGSAACNPAVPPGTAAWDATRFRKVEAPSALPANPKQAYGEQKPDLSLIPPVSLHHMALAFEEGARKYGAFNWRENPVECRTYIAAGMRHLADALDGTDRASDSDVLNLAHTMACCAIVIDAMEIGNLIDNRPKPGKSAEVLEKLKTWKIARAAERAERAERAK